MTHYDITMGKVIARDTLFVTSQWVMTLLGKQIVMSQWVITLLCIHHNAQWHCYEPLLWCITTPTFDIVVSPINSLKLYTYTIKINIKSIVVEHKNKTKFVVIICRDHVHWFWSGYFMSSQDSNDLCRMITQWLVLVIIRDIKVIIYYHYYHTLGALSLYLLLSILHSHSRHNSTNWRHNTSTMTTCNRKYKWQPYIQQHMLFANCLNVWYWVMNYTGNAVTNLSLVLPNMAMLTTV